MAATYEEYMEAFRILGLTSDPIVTLDAYGREVVSLAAGASPSFDTLLTGDTEIQGFIFEALSGAPASAIRIAQNNVAKANNKLRSCEVYTVGGNAVVMGGADNTNGCEVAYVLAESTGTHATFNGAIMAREDFT